MASPTGADYTVLASTGSAFNNTGLWGSAADVDIAASRFLSGDLNNDARDDLVVVTPRRATHPSGATYSAVTSTGSRFNSPAAWGGADSIDVAGSRFAVADFNNDGSEDLLAVTDRGAGSPSGADYNVLTSTGSAFGSPGVWSFADGIDVVGSRFVTPDLTGEGRSDVVAVTARRAGAPSGASYTALTSSGSAFTNAGVWGFSDDVDIGALAE